MNYCWGIPRWFLCGKYIYSIFFGGSRCSFRAVHSRERDRRERSHGQYRSKREGFPGHAGVQERRREQTVQDTHHRWYEHHKHVEYHKKTQMCLAFLLCFINAKIKGKKNSSFDSIVCIPLDRVTFSLLIMLFIYQSSNPEVWRWIWSQACLLIFSSCVCDTPTTPTMTSGSPPSWTPPSTPSRVYWRWDSHWQKMQEYPWRWLSNIFTWKTLSRFFQQNIW